MAANKKDIGCSVAGAMSLGLARSEETEGAWASRPSLIEIGDNLGPGPERLGTGGVGLFLKSKTRLTFIVSVAVVTAVVSWWLVEQAKKRVILMVDGAQAEVSTYSRTVSDLLMEQRVEIGPGDSVAPERDTILADGMTIKVVHAFPVRLLVDGQERIVRTLPDSVGGLLRREQVELSPLDRVKPDLGVQVEPGIEIRVIRVSRERLRVEEEIPAPVRREEDPALERGLQVVRQAGKPGLRRKIIEVTYEDGKEVSRQVIADEVVRPAREKVVAVGTMRLAARGGESFRFRRALWVTATAYSGDGITATGVVPQRGTVAVDPAVIPLGQRVYVEGYGYGIAADVGSAIKGQRIDVYFPDREQAVRWGVRRVKVYVLE